MAKFLPLEQTPYGLALATFLAIICEIPADKEHRGPDVLIEFRRSSQGLEIFYSNGVFAYE
jgi:hypothetical protein